MPRFNNKGGSGGPDIKINGGQAVGNVLTASVGSGYVVGGYQWRRSTDGGATFTNIAGATNASYTLTAQDDGCQISCNITVSSINSSAVQVAVSPPVLVSAPVINGGATVGSPLNVTAAAFTGNGLSISTKVFLDNAEIVGAGLNYTPLASDVGHTIKVRQTASNAGGTVSADSTGVSVVNEQYQFASNRTRSPWSLSSAGANLFQVSRIYLGDAPFDSHSYRIALPAHYTKNDGSVHPETAAPNVVNIEGISIGYSATKDPTTATWIAGTIGGQAGVTLDPATNSVGVLSDDIIPKNAKIPAGYHRWVMVAYNVPSGGSFPNAAQMQPSQSFEGVATAVSTSQAAKLTNGAAITTGANGTGGAYGPAYVVCKGHNKPAFLVWGDSIGDGQNELLYSFTDGVYGFISRGLNSTVNGRMFGGNHCIPGSKPSHWVTYGRSEVSKKLDLIALCPNVPFTHIISEHGTNAQWTTFTDFVNGMKAYRSLLAAEYPSKRVYQTTMIAKITATTDGFSTTAGQTPASGYAEGGYAWQYNDKLIADNIDGAFDGHIITYTYTSDATNRDKFKVGPFTTTLAAAYTANAATVSLTDAPLIGDALVIDPTGAGSAVGASRTVKSVSGTGPYTVGLNYGFSFSAAAGVLARTNPSPDGIHLSATYHKATQPAIENFKALF